MLRSETIDPLSDERWRAFVEHSPAGSVFHSPEWLALLHRQYRYPLLARCLSDGGELVAGLPFALVDSRLTGRRLVAVPFSDTCGPVLREQHDETALPLLLDGVREAHLRESIDMEIRARLPGLGRDGERFHHHEVPLEGGPAAVGQRFTKMASRGVARARRDGVEIVRATDERALRDFYRLHLATRRRQGVPTQSKRFMRRFTALFERSLGFVLLARLQGETIAAAVFLSFNGVLTYKYGASDRGRLRHRPNHAIFAEAIRFACGQGMHTLDLGRTDLDNEGLRSFKLGWGAIERPIAYTLLSARQARPAAPRARKALSATITHTPPLTGRLIGAALYRHFG